MGNLFVHWAKESKSSKEDWDQGQKVTFFQGKIDNPWRSSKIAFMRGYDRDKGHLRILKSGKGSSRKRSNERGSN